MHHKRRHAKTSPRHAGHSWGFLERRLARKRQQVRGFYTRGPKWWDVIFNVRRKRRRIARDIIAIMQGADPDDIAGELPNGKPQTYYW